MTNNAPRLRVRRIDGVAGLDRVGATLDRLNAASARPSPFSSRAFLKSYARHCEYHPRGVDVRLFTVSEGEKTIAVLPLRRAMDGFVEVRKIKAVRELRLEFLSTHDSEQVGLVCAPEDEERASRALIGHLTRKERGWGILELVGQRPGSALHLAAHNATDRKYRVRDIKVEPFTEIALNFPDLKTYFRSLVKHMRSNISRQARRLYASGEVELVLAEGASAVAPWFDAYLDLDGRSWKAGTESSISRHRLRLDFYRELVGGRAGLEPSFIGVVLNGVLIAGLVVGSNGAASPARHGGWCMEMAYDQSQASLGPGQLLLLMATGEAITRSDGYLNFLQNFAYYKHRWGAADIPVVNVQIIRRLSLHNVRAMAGDAKRWWLARQALAATEAGDTESEETESDPKNHPAPRKATETNLERSRALTMAAVQSRGAGMRRLDRAAARTYLPFPIE